MRFSLREVCITEFTMLVCVVPSLGSEVKI